MWKSQDNRWGLVLSPSSYGFQELNSGCRSWWQEFTCWATQTHSLLCVSYCYEMLLSERNSRVHLCQLWGPPFPTVCNSAQLRVNSEVPEGGFTEAEPHSWGSHPAGVRLFSFAAVLESLVLWEVSSPSKTCLGITALVCPWCSVYGKEIFAHVSSGKCNHIYQHLLH